jgi:integrase
LSTGARKGEILNLKWKDLDIERQTVRYDRKLWMKG